MSEKEECETVTNDNYKRLTQLDHTSQLRERARDLHENTWKSGLSVEKSLEFAGFHQEITIKQNILEKGHDRHGAQRAVRESISLLTMHRLEHDQAQKDSVMNVTCPLEYLAKHCFARTMNIFGEIAQINIQNEYDNFLI